MTDTTLQIVLARDELEALGFAADLLEMTGADLFERGVKSREEAQVAEGYLRWAELVRAVEGRAVTA